jgi:hypothetical protein
MLGLERFLGNLGGGPMVVHLGGRHIGTGPFESKGQGVQIEVRRKQLFDSSIWKIPQRNERD